MGGIAREIGGLDIFALEEIPLPEILPGIEIELDSILAVPHMIMGIAADGFDLQPHGDGLAGPDGADIRIDIEAGGDVAGPEAVQLEVEEVGGRYHTSKHSLVPWAISHHSPGEEALAAPDGRIGKAIGPILRDVNEVVREVHIVLIGTLANPFAPVVKRCPVVIGNLDAAYSAGCSVRFAICLNIGHVAVWVSLADDLATSIPDFTPGFPDGNIAPEGAVESIPVKVKRSRAPVMPIWEA